MKNSIAILIARILMAFIFVPSGMFKLIDNASATEYIGTVGGLPAAGLLSWGTGIFEVALGLAIIVGFKTRIAAALLVPFCIATALIFHAGQGAVPSFSEAANAALQQLHMIMVMKNISMAGGLLLLATVGAGSISLDAKFAK